MLSPQIVYRRGNGDPNGTLTAPKGMFFYQEDGVGLSLWMNVDGATAWSPAVKTNGCFLKNLFFNNINASTAGTTITAWNTTPIYELAEFTTASDGIIVPYDGDYLVSA